MKINEILTESENLQEGPILNKIGTAIGKGVGTAAKGVGAVAGGIAGLGKAFKKGYQAGKTAVGSGGDDDDIAAATADAKTRIGSTDDADSDTAQQTTTKPDTTVKTTPTTPEPKPKVQPTQRVEPTLEPENPAPEPTQGTEYAKIQKAIGQLQPTQKQEIVTMLQNDPKVQAAQKAAADRAAAKKVPVTNPKITPKPVAKKTKTAPTAKTVSVKQKQLTPSGFGQMVQGLSKGS